MRAEGNSVVGHVREVSTEKFCILCCLMGSQRVKHWESISWFTVIGDFIGCSLEMELRKQGVERFEICLQEGLEILLMN